MSQEYMRIDRFKQALKDGGSRPNLFQVTGTFPTGANGSTASTDIQFLIKSASLPAATLGTIEVPYRGRLLKMAGDRVFEPWTITVINSSSFALRNAFEKWSEIINGIATNQSAINLDDYFKTWTVHQIARDGTVAQSYTLEGCFPESIGPIELSHDSGNRLEEFQVTLVYQYWTHTGVTAP